MRATYLGRGVGIRAFRGFESDEEVFFAQSVAPMHGREAGESRIPSVGPASRA